MQDGSSNGTTPDLVLDEVIDEQPGHICPGCKKWRPESSFEGAGGKPVKRCESCRQNYRKKPPQKKAAPEPAPTPPAGELPPVQQITLSTTQAEAVLSQILGGPVTIGVTSVALDAAAIAAHIPDSAALLPLLAIAETES